ncbi:MAG: hypothetical protein Phog2KO_22060 [Phototrophicaceae bacterium]
MDDKISGGQIKELIQELKTRTSLNFRKTIYQMDKILREDSQYIKYHNRRSKNWSKSDGEIFTRPQFEDRFTKLKIQKYHPSIIFALVKVFADSSLNASQKIHPFEIYLLYHWTGNEVNEDLEKNIRKLYLPPEWNTVTNAYILFQNEKETLGNMNWFSPVTRDRIFTMLDYYINQARDSLKRLSLEHISSHSPSIKSLVLAPIHSKKSLEQFLIVCQNNIKQGKLHSLDKHLDFASSVIEENPKFRFLLGQLDKLRGMLYIRKGKHELASHYLLQAVKRIDDSQQAELYANLGANEFYQANYEASQEYHNKSLELSTKSNDLLITSFSLTSLGAIAVETMCYTNAKNYYGQALQIAQGLDHTERCAYLHMNLGELYSLTNEFGKAMAYYQKALYPAKAMLHLDIYAQTQLYILQLRAEGDADDFTKPELLELLADLKDTNLQWLQALILVELGRLHVVKDQLVHSYKKFLQALEIGLTIRNPEIIAKSLLGIALSIKSEQSRFLDYLPEELQEKLSSFTIEYMQLIKAKIYFEKRIDVDLAKYMNLRSELKRMR